MRHSEKPINPVTAILRDENTTTRVLYALLAYKPVRDSVVRLLTAGELDPDSITWDDIEAQAAIPGGIPDLLIDSERACIVVEVKTEPSTPLSPNQPGGYMQWLHEECGINKSKCFAAILPPDYYHQEVLQGRIDRFHSEYGREVEANIVSWTDILEEFQQNDLDSLSPYVRDFAEHLRAQYERPPVSFAYEEVTIMYDKEVPSAIEKLTRLVDTVIEQLRPGGHDLRVNKRKAWWTSDGDEYGCYVNLGGRNELWFGIWTTYWKKHGVPLCYGVSTEKCEPAVIHAFRERHPRSVELKDWDLLVCEVEKDRLLDPGVERKLVEEILNEVNVLKSAAG